jgi:hypothetical protein
MHSFEFAKRFFVRGIEVSPLNWTQLFTVSNPLTVLATFIAGIYQRKVDIYPLFTRAMVRECLAIFWGKYPSTFSSVNAIFLQTILISSKLGIKLITKEKDRLSVGLDTNCKGD